MYRRDYVDLVGGGYLFALGLFSVFYSYIKYDVGSLGFMGPGYFPIVLGVVVSILGVIIFFSAIYREGDTLSVKVAPTFFVILGIVVFGLILDFLGLVVAAFFSAYTSSLADKSLKGKHRLILSLVVSFLAYLIFAFGLGMQLNVWPW